MWRVVAMAAVAPEGSVADDDEATEVEVASIVVEAESAALKKHKADRTDDDENDWSELYEAFIECILK